MSFCLEIIPLLFVIYWSGVALILSDLHLLKHNIIYFASVLWKNVYNRTSTEKHTKKQQQIMQ